MKNVLHQSRRDFLKASAAGAAGIMVGGISVQEASAANVWTNGMQINPNIDNLRVVYCHDTAMSGTSTMVNSKVINDAVNNTVLWSNMDKMAMTLAQKTTPAEAWATIFRKPVGKTWANVRVAIKGIMERPAIDAKICNVLHDLGVPYANMVLFDGFCWPKYLPDAPFMPQGIVMGGGDSPSKPTYVGLGGVTMVPVTAGGVTRDVPCPTDLATGAIDIMVNIATNRGHNITAGGLTGCMKTHFGTFCFLNVLQTPLHLDPMIAPVVSVNKHDAIIGGNPVRQQLCIMDTLWGMSTFSSGWDYQPNVLLMGTFAPAVDYLCITKIRVPDMHTGAVPSQYLNRILQDFGYTQSQQDGLNWIPMGSATHASSLSQNQHATKFQMMVSNPAFKQTAVNFDLPFSGHLRITTAIYDQKGRLIREMVNHWQEEAKSIVWDGLSSSGIRVPAGAYAVKVTCGDVSRAGSIMIIHQ